jgi:hypothetical protein
MGNLRAHNVENYDVSKKVQLWLQPKDSSDPLAFITAGSIKGVTIEPKSTTLPHFSNYLGERAKDREVTTQRELSIGFTFEEFNIENLKLVFGFGFGAADTGTKDKKYDKSPKNPGGGGEVDLGKTSIKNLQVRSVELETSITYDEGYTLATDTTDDTAGGDFNNVTSPLTVVGATATYPNSGLTVGRYIKIGSEVLRVTAVSGADVTFARGEFGTTAAAHVNGTSIFKGTVKDYVQNLTTGKLYIVAAGAGNDAALDDEGAIATFHVQFEKAVNVHSFEMFPGDPVECTAQLQVGEEIWGPFEGAILKNNGALALGDGSDWRDVPMTLEITVDADGTFGEGSLIDEGQSA